MPQPLFHPLINNNNNKSCTAKENHIYTTNFTTSDNTPVFQLLNQWIRSSKLVNETTKRRQAKTYKIKIPLKKDLYRSTLQQKVYNPNWVSK